MRIAPRHLTPGELEQGLTDVLSSPRDVGRLEFIVVRPAPDERRSLTAAKVTLEGGIDGDRWASEHSPRTDDRRPDPRKQVTLMNSRILRQIAGHEDAVSLAGDNLIVDLDFSEDNLPDGSRLAIGESVVIEITEIPHTGCTSFAARYGKEARAFVNTARGLELHLRGRHGRIVTGGTITVGDAVRKVLSFAG
jgi:MOSC domain-containing protein YiiM